MAKKQQEKIEDEKMAFDNVKETKPLEEAIEAKKAELPVEKKQEEPLQNKAEEKKEELPAQKKQSEPIKVVTEEPPVRANVPDKRPAVISQIARETTFIDSGIKVKNSPFSSNGLSTSTVN